MSDDSSAPIVARLRRFVTAAAPGARLPTTRTLVAEHHASPLTVQQALRTLAAEGLVESRPGAGTFVRARPATRPVDSSWQTTALGAMPARAWPVTAAMRPAAADTIAWHAGYPDRELLPERLVRAALARAARADAGLVCPPVAGLPDLRAWFAAELRDTAGGGHPAPTASDVIVLPGSQGGLSSIFRALAGRGRPVLLESPTYWGAILAAAQAGVEVVPVATGPTGPDPDELARVFAETGARVLYAQPTFANPTGVQWTRDTAAAVLAVARRSGAFVVEDDWAHDFAISAVAAPLAAGDDSGHVVYLRSLTKSVSPSVRIAAIIARGPARERILADRAADTLYVSGVLQAAALDVVTQPGWRAHLRAVGKALGARRDLLLDSLTRFTPAVRVDHVPAGGLNLWARLADGTDPVAVARACELDGLLVAPGGEWFPAEPSGPYLRLSFAGPDPSSYPAGARILARALDAVAP